MKMLIVPLLITSFATRFAHITVPLPKLLSCFIQGVDKNVTVTVSNILCVCMLVFTLAVCVMFMSPLTKYHRTKTKKTRRQTNSVVWDYFYVLYIFNS